LNIEKILTRIGGVLSQPHKTFELMTVEGTSLGEGFLVSTLSLLALALSSALTPQNSPVILTFVFVLVFGLIALVTYLFAFFKIVESAYKAPGYFSEFLAISSYALTPSVFPLAIISLMAVISPIDPLIYMLFSLATGIVWFIWFNFLLYKASQVYFKIDLKQFIIALFISWVVLTVIIVVLALIFAALISFILFFPYILAGGV